MIALAVLWLGLVAIMLVHDRPDQPWGRSVMWQVFWRGVCGLWLALVLATSQV